MLSVEAPAKFVLTLQSVPPFLVESILALALVVLLAVPLIAHVQLLLDNSSKASTMVASIRRRYNRTELRDPGNRTVVMHYPAPVRLDSSSNSDLNIELASMRTTCSTPTIKRSAMNHTKETTKENFVNHEDDQHKQVLQEMLLQKQKTCLPLERSSPFLETKSQLPIIDISAFDYDSYRHKLIEASLKRQYGDRQAPGNVVLNSIHLNSISSQSGIQLNEKYSHSLFDFIEEYYDATKAMSKKETEYLHPLDHFLVKGSERPKTTERATETKESNTELDQVPELVDFRDQSPIPASNSPAATPGRRRVLEESKHASKLTIRSRRSSSIPRTSSQSSLTAKSPARNSSANPTAQQLFNRAENRPSSAFVVSTEKPEERRRNSPLPRVSRSRTPRGNEFSTFSQSNKSPQGSKVPGVSRKRASSLVQGKSSNESLTPGTAKPSEYSEAVSTDRDEKESVTCASASSSEAGSSYSCSSRPREKRFVRSRASSLSSKSRTIRTPSQTRQWYVGGNPNTSFNRNYVETPRESFIKPTKPKVSSRPRSTGGRFDWDVPDVPGRNWCDDTTADRSKDQPVAPFVPERPRTANCPLNRRRTPEKGKISDTVLPVLESVIDLQVESRNSNEREDQQIVQKSPLPKLREFKRPARSRDKKISSESFVKSSIPQQSNEDQKKIVPDEKSEDKVNPSSIPVIIEKSSSEIKSTRPSSISRLPVHVGVDKAKMKKLIQDTSRTLSNDSGKLLDKSPHLDKNSSNVLRKTKRPRTAGCVRSRTSSLSPKVELSLENFQTAETAASPPTDTLNKGRDQSAPKISNQRVTSKANNLKTPSASSSLKARRITPPSPASSNKISKPSTPRVSEDDTDSSKKSSQHDNTVRRPFLRARSGNYGAPKRSVIEKTSKNPTATTSANEEKEDDKELSKLPTEGSKAALVMRRELKTYIKKIKLILSNRDQSLQARDLASLSISQAIIPELRALLSPREIQELHGLLDTAEKHDGNINNDGLAALARLQ